MFSLALNFLPTAAITADNFQAFISVAIGFGTLLFVGFFGAVMYFAIRYRRPKGNVPGKTEYLPGNYTVEFIGIFGISIWVAVFFVWGWRDYSYMVSPQMDEYEINVIGQQWSWQIQYANGKTLTNELYVPRGRPVKLVMTSKDVLHSFFVPEFRTKQDTVPGQFTVLHINANKTGQFHIFCAEYCGTAHSKMIGRVYVLEQNDFKNWLEGLYVPPTHAGEKLTPELEVSKNSPQLSLAQQGELVFKSKACVTCHTVNGAPLIGPSLKGVFGSEVELIGGTKVNADENYIRESIMDPMKKIVKGFAPAMPTFRGMLSDEEVNQLIAYLKTLK
ncbi:MAG: cytochrome c oxidase subunit II [Bdellovibrionota bacterium]